MTRGSARPDRSRSQVGVLVPQLLSCLGFFVGVCRVIGEPIPEGGLAMPPTQEPRPEAGRGQGAEPSDRSLLRRLRGGSQDAAS